MAVPLMAMFWRALDSGELEKNLTSHMVVHAMKLSAITSTISLALAIVFGTPVAYLLARRNFPGKFLVDLLVDLPIVLPPTVAGVALLVAFGRRGVLGQHFDELGHHAGVPDIGRRAGAALRLGAVLHTHAQSRLRERQP